MVSVNYDSDEAKICDVGNVGLEVKNSLYAISETPYSDRFAWKPRTHRLNETNQVVKLHDVGTDNIVFTYFGAYAQYLLVPKKNSLVAKD